MHKCIQPLALQLNGLLSMQVSWFANMFLELSPVYVKFCPQQKPPIQL